MSSGEQCLGAPTLVVCIGNSLAADDGVAGVVYNRLSTERLPETVRLLELGLGGIDLLDHLDGESRLIVVDAVQLGALPGTVHLFDWEGLPVQQIRAVSGHGVGIREAIEVGRRLYPEKVPKEIFLVGIEGKCFDQLGFQLSPEVAAAVPEALAAIRALL